MKNKIKDNKIKVVAVIGATVIAIAGTVGIVKIAKTRRNDGTK